MKKIISFMVMVCLLVLSVCVMTGCGEDDSSATAGLRLVKYKGDEFYTVIGFNISAKDDGYVDLENVEGNFVLDIEKIANGKEVGAISQNAFKGVSVINEIVVPTTVTEIGAGAFNQMADLEKLTVPFIGENANSDSSIGASKKAENKAVDLNRTIYYWFGTDEFDGGAQVTSKYNSTADETTYYLPVNFKTLSISAKEDYEVPAYACYNNKILENLIVNDKVTKLGDYSFAECTHLVSFNEKAVVDIDCGTSAIECTHLSIKDAD